MKTAEVYIKGWNLPEAKTVGDQDWKTSIEIIQLDAFKAGAEWAANMYKQTAHLAKNTEHYDLRIYMTACANIDKRMNQAILSAASNLKELPK